MTAGRRAPARLPGGGSVTFTAASAAEAGQTRHCAARGPLTFGREHALDCSDTCCGRVRKLTGLRRRCR